MADRFGSLGFFLLFFPGPIFHVILGVNIICYSIDLVAAIPTVSFSKLYFNG